MGDKITTVIGWILGLVLAYLFLVNYKGATSIADTTLKGSTSMLKVLQGR